MAGGTRPPVIWRERCGDALHIPLLIIVSGQGEAPASPCIPSRQAGRAHLSLVFLLSVQPVEEGQGPFCLAISGIEAVELSGDDALLEAVGSQD